MKTSDVNTTLIEGYIGLLGNLSRNNKLDLISKLALSLKNNNTRNKNSFYEAFGAWESEKSADEILKK